MTRWQAVAVGIPVVAFGLAAWDPARNGGPPLCPWRACTGVACPGCGMTRATGALLRGRAGEAAHVHPLVFLVAVQVAAIWLVALLITRRASAPRHRPPTWVMPTLLGVNAVVFAAVWGARLVGGSLPTV